MRRYGTRHEPATRTGVGERAAADRAVRIAAGRDDRQARAAGWCARSFRPGRPIVVEGDLTDRFYVLISGLAAVTQEGRGARAILRPGEAFGEVAPLMRMERTATVTAMTKCVVASCDRETFTELLRPLYVSD